MGRDTWEHGWGPRNAGEAVGCPLRLPPGLALFPPSWSGFKNPDPSDDAFPRITAAAAGIAWVIQLGYNLFSSHSSFWPSPGSGADARIWIEPGTLGASCYLTPLVCRGTKLVRTKLVTGTFGSNMSLDPDAGGLPSPAPPSALSFPLSFFSVIDCGGLNVSYT